MSIARYVQLLVVSSLLAVISTAHCPASPILLAQFTLSVAAPEFGSAPPTVDFGFRAYQPGPFPTPVYFTWQEPYQVSDVGMTFLAPTEVVEGVNDARTSTSAEYSLDIGPANFATWVLNQPSTCDHACLEVLVPDIAAHTIMSVERIIDQLIITPQGNRHFLQGKQRIRLWGEPIPEPTAVAMLPTAVGCFALVTARNRRTRTLQAHVL